MVYEDTRVPKEKFLLDYFSSLRSSPTQKPEKAFDEVLKSVQIKIEKKQLEPLIADPSKPVDKILDNLSPQDALSALKESVKILTDILGS
ncbi:MAG: hypothetical protein WC490_02070 [Candidatus Margulisiibacteriota bacterium]